MDPHTAFTQPMPSGIYPFWFWNGDITDDEIRWQVAQMAAQGIRGFYVHSRQGLRQPYLSAEFFRLFNTAVDAAETHGLTAHIYDEYPYPSGVAGGQVVLGDPAHLGTRLVQESFDWRGGPLERALPQGKILCCTAYPLEGDQVGWDAPVDLLDHVGTCLPEDSYFEGGLTPYNRKRYMASAPTPTLLTRALDGPHRVFVSAQVLIETNKYWGHYPDVLDGPTIQRFLQLTHQRYRQHCGERFGRSVLTCFVDETTPHWSPHLMDTFADRFGYELAPNLPALQNAKHPAHVRVSADLQQLRYERFCSVFEKPVRDWCHDAGLRYCGEKNVLRLAQLQFMDIPGCDPGHTKAGAPHDLLRTPTRQNARAVASAAYFYGKEGALCECFHSLGWSATLQDAKLIAENLLWMGIRYLVPHGFFYTTHGLTKHDAPPSLFFQMPWWEHFGKLTRRLNRIAAALEDTHIDPNVLVVEPNGGLPNAADLETYAALLEVLPRLHADFMMVDTDMLASGRVEDGHVRIRDASVPLIVRPPMRYVEPGLQEWLESFAAAGGQVIELEPGMEAGLVNKLLEPLIRPALELRIALPPGNQERVGSGPLGEEQPAAGDQTRRRPAADESRGLVPLGGGQPAEQGRARRDGAGREEGRKTERAGGQLIGGERPSAQRANLGETKSGARAGGQSDAAGPANTGGPVQRRGSGVSGPAHEEQAGHTQALPQKIAGQSGRGQRAGAQRAEQIQLVTRTGQAGSCYFLLNLHNTPCDLEIRSGKALFEVPLDDPVPPRLENTQLGWRRPMAPFESVLLMENAGAGGHQAHGEPAGPPAPDGNATRAQAGAAAASRSVPIVEVAVPAQGRVRACSPNLLRMGEWAMSVARADGSRTEPVTVPAVPLANQLAAGGVPFAPALRTRFGQAPTWELPELDVLYEFAFESAFDGPVELVVEPGSLIGDWSVTVNDGPPLHAADLKPSATHVRGSLGVDITPHLRSGTNHIQAQVRTARHDGGLRNPLYLSGDFGVELQPLRLTPPRERGRFERWSEAGMPFYAGVVEFTAPVELTAVPDAEHACVALSFPHPFQGACEVAFNRGEPRTALWSPYLVVVPTADLRTGRNELTLRVYTSLLRAFEGQFWDIALHQARWVTEGVGEGTAQT